MLFAALLLCALLSDAHATSHYSSFFNQTFPWKANASSPAISTLSVAKATSTSVSVASPLFSQTPFSSVFGVNITVDAVANLAFPFTGPTGTYQDVDTGIDVVAGGTITFWIPLGYTGGSWCYELGREGAGFQYCSGPAGAWYSGSDPTVPIYLYNSKINGAYVSTDPAVPQYVEAAAANLTVNNHAVAEPGNVPWNLTQFGTNRGFTWTRSGSIVFRIGAKGAPGQNSALSYNFNEPTTDYDSAFDSTAENLHPNPTVNVTQGLVGRNVVTPISGRLWLACWRWNLYGAQLNYGQTWTLINYTSPVQLSATWTPSSAALGSASEPYILKQQPLPSTVVLPDTFSSSAGGDQRGCCGQGAATRGEHHNQRLLAHQQPAVRPAHPVVLLLPLPQHAPRARRRQRRARGLLLRRPVRRHHVEQCERGAPPWPRTRATTACSARWCSATTA